MFEFYNLQILYLRTATSYLQIRSFACVTFNDSISLYTVTVSNFCHHFCHPAVVNVAEIYWIQGLSYFCKRSELLLQLISWVICLVDVTFIIWCVLLCSYHLRILFFIFSYRNLKQIASSFVCVVLSAQVVIMWFWQHTAAVSGVIFTCAWCVLRGDNIISLTGLIHVKCNSMEQSYSQLEEGLWCSALPCFFLSKVIK